MASTTALFTGLSGLISNARRLDVIGNNIANVNTTAFKSNRLSFAPTFSRNFALGSAPSDNGGGSNPGQVGLGVSISGTQRSFNNGAIGATGISTDLAIEGDGFFVVEMNGEQSYTRDGSFLRNANNELVTQSGGRVLGFPVDDQFNLMDGSLQDLSVPLGTQTVAEATRNVIFNGNLNASGDVATTGSQHTSRAFYTTPAGPGGEVTGAEDLTAVDIWMDDGLGGRVLAFDAATQPKTITMNGAEKGGTDLGEQVFTVGVDGSTLDDFALWLEDKLGIDGSTVGGQTLSGGVSFNAAGQLVIDGNEGEVQALDLDTADFMVGNNVLAQPFVLDETGQADGESVRTSFVVYDSLGTPITIDISMVLQETTPSGGTSWAYIAESGDNAATDRVTGLGVVEFDSDGRFLSSSSSTIQLQRDNGAITPLNVELQFDEGADTVSGLTDSQSTIAAIFQDGSAIGTLSNFSIAEDGLITGSFTNGLTRTIGRIALAKFSNPEGLVDAGGNLFKIGPNSGTPLIASPLEFGTGRVVGGALELSNVDLSQEFINMILASTGYSASSRVITTTDELINQLLVLGR